jgi:hypothetical protein
MLPFLYYKDAIELQNTYFNQTFKEMGTLVFENLVTLKTTATASASPVTISVYAWAEDVQLYGPSAILFQGTEVDDAPKASAIASAVADMAGKLSGVPIIGWYATATSIAARTVSTVLKLFGWSRPPIIEGVRAFMPRFPFLHPSPLVSFQDDVIALDPRNEVTIDPSTVGAYSSADPLLIDSFARKPAIFDTVLWQVSDIPNTCLATIPVTPVIYHAEWLTNTPTAPSTNCARVAMTPACYASQLFDFWRGTMCLRIRVVASQFHRGRLLVTWDPAQNTTSVQTDATVISDVLDLSQATSLVFKVPFLSDVGMLGVNKAPSAASTSAIANLVVWGNRSTSFDGDYNLNLINGVVVIRVFNELQCGDATADVHLVLETWMEDLVLARPTVDTNTYPESGSVVYHKSVSMSSFMNSITLQGGELAEDQITDEIQVTENVDYLGLLYAGESVPSLRTLLHRSYVWKAVVCPLTAEANAECWSSYTFPRFPVAFHTSSSLVQNEDYNGAGTLKSNGCNTTPVSYLTACFAGYRGSMGWQVSPLANQSTSCFSFLGRTAVPSNTGWKSTTYSKPADNYAAIYTARMRTRLIGAAAAGLSTTLSNIGGVMSAIFPMYSNWRMHAGNGAASYKAGYTTNRYNPMQSDFLQYTAVNSTATSTSTNVSASLSVSAGTDFNVFEFVNIPDTYVFWGVSLI